MCMQTDGVYFGIGQGAGLREIGKGAGAESTDLLNVVDAGVALRGEVVPFRQQGEDVRAGETVARQVLHLHRGVPLLDLVVVVGG